MGCECGNFSLVEREWSVPSLNDKGHAEELQMTLEGITAVRGVRVKVRERTVLVGFDAAHISAQQLKDAMNKAGFQVILA